MTAKPNPTTPPKKKKSRSPNYPVLSLKKAVARAAELWAVESRHAFPTDSSSKHWGYKNAMVSGAIQTLAALRYFGLAEPVEPSSDGAERKFRLTQNAINIVASPQGDPKRAAAVCASLTTPAMYIDLLKQYGTSLPSEQTITTYLVRDKKFSPIGAKALISCFRESLSYATEETGGKIDLGSLGSSGESGRNSGPNEAIEDEDDPDMPPEVMEKNKHNFKDAKVALPPDYGDERWNLPSGPVTFRAPLQLTAVDFEVLDLYITAFKRRNQAVVPGNGSAATGA